MLVYRAIESSLMARMREGGILRGDAVAQWIKPESTGVFCAGHTEVARGGLLSPARRVYSASQWKETWRTSRTNRPKPIRVASAAVQDETENLEGRIAFEARPARGAQKAFLPRHLSACLGAQVSAPPFRLASAAAHQNWRNAKCI